MSQLEAAPRSRTKIVVVHSQRIVLEGLSALLRHEKGLEVVWSGTTAEAALEAIFRCAPDVALIEIDLPKMTGFELARRVRMADSPSELILIGERRGGALQSAVEQCGARGYVPTDASAELLFDAIRNVAEHKSYYQGAQLRGVPPERKEKVGIEALSNRELDVLRCLTDGLSSREIAAHLNLSFRTVDGYRASLMDKLFIRTIPGLVKFAIRHRLTDLDR